MALKGGAELGFGAEHLVARVHEPGHTGATKHSRQAGRDGYAQGPPGPQKSDSLTEALDAGGGRAVEGERKVAGLSQGELLEAEHGAICCPGSRGAIEMIASSDGALP